MLYWGLIPCEEAHRLINTEHGQLVDVRVPSEYKMGALTGAINIPLQVIYTAKEKLDKSRPVILYCQTGVRARLAKEYLDWRGFEQVHNLGGWTNYFSCMP